MDVIQALKRIVHLVHIMGFRIYFQGPLKENFRMCLENGVRV